MKLFVIAGLLTFFAISAVTPFEVINADAVKTSRENLKAANQKCQSNPATAVDREALKAYREGGAQPTNYGLFAFCLSQALGWQNADGSINKDVIRTRAENIYGASTKLNEALDECTQAQSTSEETAIKLTKCYLKYFPRTKGTNEQ